ncbi:MAG TPA: SCO family protein [Solirubrobacteraceae bacterium]|nr:SCO family protein [Solirubrobacteraceae bacterium]
MPARVRLALMVAATLALLAALGVVLLARPGGGGSGGDAWAGALRPAIPPQDFRLRDERGRPASLRQYRGDVVVLTFLYTSCKDVCPTTATTIRGALDDVGHDVPALAVSVDPGGDTPAAARRFLLQRRLNGGRMRFLLGDRAQLAPVWRDYGIRPQSAEFDHSAYVLLIDRRGRQRISFPVEHLTSEGLAHDIRRLERE